MAKKSINLSIYLCHVFWCSWYVQVLTLFLNPESIVESILIIVITAIVGVVIYGYLGLKSKLVNFLFGSKVDNVKEKLHLKYNKINRKGLPEETLLTY